MSTVSGLGSGWGKPRLQLGHSDPALIRIQRLGSMEEDMGPVLKPLFTFYIKPEHVRSKMSAFLWSRKIRESTAKGPAKG